MLPLPSLPSFCTRLRALPRVRRRRRRRRVSVVGPFKPRAALSHKNTERLSESLEVGRTQKNVGVVFVKSERERNQPFLLCL